MKNRKLWLILLCVLLTAAIMVAVFWQTLIVYIAPRLVLAGALRERISELEDRIASSPIPILSQGIDLKGNQQVGLQLDTQNAVLGDIRYDMQVLLEQNPRRILADGKAVFRNTEMDLSLYLDGDFAAVSSKEILEGKFYGLTYDTFSRDIRSNKLLAMLIGEKTLSGWETSVSALQKAMQTQMTDVPDLSAIDAKSLAMGILAMDMDVERVEIDLNGEEQVYHVVSFEATVAEIASGLQYLKLELPNMPAGDAQIKFSFWLKERQLCKLEAEADDWSLDMYWGSAAVSFLMDDDIYIEYYNGSAFKTCKVHTEQQEGMYRETITYTGEETVRLSYDWVASTGGLALTVDTKGEQTELSLLLKPVENGFSLETDDFGALMHILAEMPDTADDPCVMTVTKGADFDTPEYKNFIDWSMEDLLTLLSGFGSLLGLDLQ